MAYTNKIVVPIVFFIALGFFFLSWSETSFGQPLEPGCCITNGDQCSPSCGPAGTSCQNDGTFNPCKNESTVGACGITEFNCFVVGAVCFQVTSNDGVCQAGEPAELGCCGNIQNPDNGLCEENVTFEDCQNLEGSFASAGSCQPDNSCFPPTPIPTMSEWGGIITAGLLGLIAIFFVTRRFVLRRSS